MTINASREFYLDIWVDWNNDGVFATGTDVYRFSSSNAPVTTGRLIMGAGTNSLALNVPSNVQSGQRTMRFRLTDAVTGANTLGVNQTAYETVNGSQVVAAGEIVDLPIMVQSNPYQNAVISTDVNDSGAVTPLDALNIINLIAKYKASSIPLNPLTPEVATLINGFKPDVNGDGVVTALDALRVINYLANNRRSAASGEGEANSNTFYAVGNGLLASPLTVATTGYRSHQTKSSWWKPACQWLRQPQPLQASRFLILRTWLLWTMCLTISRTMDVIQAITIPTLWTPYSQRLASASNATRRVNHQR